MGGRGKTRRDFRTVKSEPREHLRLVLGFSRGSLSDHIAGIVSGALAAALDKHVAIELRPGQNGVSAAREVAASEPDGKTLFMRKLLPSSLLRSWKRVFCQILTHTPLWQNLAVVREK